MKEQDGGEKKLACKKAIQCLYIAVEESVASDVDNKVSAFVHQLETELTRLRSELQQEREKVERAFVAGRSKTSWEQFQEDEKAKLNN